MNGRKPAVPFASYSSNRVMLKAKSAPGRAACRSATICGNTLINVLPLELKLDVSSSTSTMSMTSVETTEAGAQSRVVSVCGNPSGVTPAPTEQSLIDVIMTGKPGRPIT